MTAPTTAPRTWTTAEILAEATDDIDIVVDAWPDTAECIAELARTAFDIDHAGLDYSCVRAARFTH